MVEGWGRYNFSGKSGKLRNKSEERVLGTYEYVRTSSERGVSEGDRAARYWSKRFRKLPLPKPRAGEISGKSRVQNSVRDHNWEKLIGFGIQTVISNLPHFSWQQPYPFSAQPNKLKPSLTYGALSHKTDIQFIRKFYLPGLQNVSILDYFFPLLYLKHKLNLSLPFPTIPILVTLLLFSHSISYTR